MTEELKILEPAPGPFFRFTDEEAWLNAAHAEELGYVFTIKEDQLTELE